MKNKHIVLVLLLALFAGVWTDSRGQEKIKVNKPFPYPGDYVKGTIVPTGKNLNLPGQVVNFYGQWCNKYLKRIADDQLAVDAEDRGIVSEGQGYGMVIVALMARPNGNGRDTFNMLYNYYMAHRVTKRGTYLMKWDSNDKSSATDGDLDIAYALLLADKQWGSDGPVRYDTAALNILKDIRKYEVDTLDWTLLSSNMIEGDSHRKGYEEYHTLRASDFMPSHLIAFSEATGDSDWLKILKGTYKVFDQFQALHPNIGLVPDFAVKINTVPAPAPANFQGRREKHCDSYDYNACRVPWRLGVSYLLYGDSDAKRELTIMNSWIKGAVTGGEAHNIRDGYKLNGDFQNEKLDSLHLCYIAPFGVAAMIDDHNGDWLNNIWTYLMSKSIPDYASSTTHGYYDNTIKMYTMIILSGNYWKYKKNE